MSEVTNITPEQMDEEFDRLEDATIVIKNKLVSISIGLPTDKLDQLASKLASELIDRGDVTLQVTPGDTVTIPKGYHHGGGTVSGIEGSGGNYQLQSKNVTPTKAVQEIVADAGFFGLSNVIVAAIPSSYQDVSTSTVAPGDVLVTKLFIDSSGVKQTGTMNNNGAIAGSYDPLAKTEFTVPEGYHNGTGTVKITDSIYNRLKNI